MQERSETLEQLPITKRGFEALQKELEQLRTIERPKVISAIEEARAHGDLSENAEYDAAKDRQGFIEGRISELQYKINCANIIDTDKLEVKGKAIFGCTVVLENIDTGEEVTYQIVGSDESNINEGKISYTSPLGKSLIGKPVGADVTIIVPGGKRQYEIIEIK